MEETPTELLAVVVPTVIGAGVVIATVVLVFWLGTGRQTSYEDAMKRARGRAEEALRTEQKQKKEKKRLSERRRRPEVSLGKSSSEVEGTPQPPAHQKSILKGSKANSVDKVSPGRNVGSVYLSNCQLNIHMSTCTVLYVWQVFDS